MKIAIVGAGSAAFWVSTLRDFTVMKSAPGCTISLVDVNNERLDAVYDLARRYVKEVGVDIRFEKAENRRQALKNADFVLNTAWVGGHEYAEKMKAIGEKHGYYMGIDHRQVRFIVSYSQFKLALEIARDVEDICPDAWMMQISNPVFDITTLIHRQRKVKVAGFCDGFVGIYRLMMALGLSPADVYFQVAGLNHCIYLTKFQNKEDGSNLYPMIDNWIKNEAGEFWKNNEIGLWQETISPAAVDVYKHFGLYPIGDTGREFIWKYYYDLDTLKRWFGSIGGTDSSIGNPMRLKRFQANVDELFKLSNDPNASVKAFLPPQKGLDEFSDFIDAIHLGEEKRLVLNIPNNGALPQLPSDAAVEVPVNIKNRKLYPEHVDPFPSRLLNFMIIPRLLRMEWGLEAYLSGEREMLAEILIRDPRTHSEKQAREALDDILSQPENREMAAYYK